jgi:exodeoxyribonuclease V alpha subunit
MIPCLSERSVSTAGAGARAVRARKDAAPAHDPGRPGRIDDMIARWAARGWLRPLDAAFAGLLRREVPDADPWLILAAALASHQLGRGHVCLDLAATLADPGFALSLPPEGATEAGLAAEDRPGPVLAGTDLRAWLAALGDPRLVCAGAGNTPLVLRGTRLYLRRYWEYERVVREGIDARLARTHEVAATLSLPALRSTLDVLFPAANPAARKAGADWQKLACALAARSAFSIMTGGPGTGKTTTVVKLLALLQTLALSAPAKDGAPTRPLRIRLAAPTGKAAARLNESIAGAVRSLPLQGLPNEDAVRASIPTEVGTLHRLLGARPDTRRLRHDARNPLALDVLVIDEASMIDLEMMAAVLAALPPRSRLVLLGDKDQLASVEAGAVLGELCARAREGHYTAATAQWLHRATGQDIDAALQDASGTALDQAVAMLRRSYRFPEESGIGQLAARVNEGAAAAALQILAQPQRDLQTMRLRGETDPSLRDLVVDGRLAGAVAPGEDRQGYRHYLEALQRLQPPPGADAAAFDAWARAVLDAHARFQVLCALRRGPWGVEGLNPRIAGFLRSAGLIGAGSGWYLGRPVLVTRNDYALGLMNGDIGITLALPGKGDGTGERPLRVAFRTGDGNDGIKWVLPSRLQSVETVYALTVHKSQGSEFAHAALVLPDKLNPILTRELLYTGITRAKTLLTLVNPGDDELVGQAVERRVQRASGLLERREQ